MKRERGSGVPALLTLPCLSFPMWERGMSPGCPMSAPLLGKAAGWEAAAAGQGDRG